MTDTQEEGMVHQTPVRLGEERHTSAEPSGLERTRLAKVALAAWVGVSPDKLPAEKMWIEHPNHDSRKAWDRVVAAILAEAGQ